MSRQLRRAPFYVPAALVAALLAVSCLDDASGPGPPLIGQFAIAPSFASASAGIVQITQVRVILTRISDSTVALDTTVTVTPGADSVDLTFTVPVFSSSEVFLMIVEFITPAGDVAFRGGPVQVTSTTDPDAPPAPVEVDAVYVGVGSDAAAVQIVCPTPPAAAAPENQAPLAACPSSPTVLFEDTLELTAEALDTSGIAIAGTPIAWTSLDTTRLIVPDPALARLVAQSVRGPVRVVAALLTDQTDTIEIIVQPVPNAITLVSGGGQTGNTGIELLSPVVVRVDAVDGLGVLGVPVRFATADGGLFVPDSTTTDSLGQASAMWRLGPAAGTQTGTATVLSLPGLQVSFTADAIPSVATDLSIVSGDGQTGPVGTVLPESLVVRATDATGNPVPGTTVDWTVTLNDGAVNPAASLTDTLGLARAAWTLGTLVGANELLASLPGPAALVADSALGGTEGAAGAGDAGGASGTQEVQGAVGAEEAAAASTVTFTATGTAGPAAAITLKAGDAQTDTVTATLAQPLVVEVADLFGNPVSGVSVDFTVTAGGGSVSATAVTTDGSGLAQTTWTLGTLAGAQQVTATSTGLAGSPVTFSATAAHGNPVQLAFMVDPTDAFPGAAILPAVEVEIRDQFGNLATSATDNVTIGIGSNPVSGTIAGTLTVTAVSGVATFSDLSIDNIGAGYTLSASSGTLTPATSAAFAILVPPQRVAWVTVGNGNWSDGANWSTGAPPAATDTVLITQSGTYTVTLDVDVTVEDLTLGGASGTQTLLLNGRTLTVTGASLNVAPNGVLDLSSGTLTGSGTVSVQGTLNWTGGTMSGAGITLIQPTGVITIDGTGTKILSQRTLVNAGTATWVSTGTGAISAGTGAAFSNLSGASFDFQADALFDYNFSGTVPVFSNAGSLTRSVGTGSATFDVEFVNATGGIIDIQTGTLDLNGTFTHASGAILQGSGTLDITGATISGGTLAGDVRPGTSSGILTITGDFPQDTVATLNIELGGAVAGTGYDQLNVSGAATLRGALKVDTTLGYSPAIGDSLTVVTFGSRSGTLASITVRDLRTGIGLDTVSTTASFNIVAKSQIVFAGDSGFLGFTYYRVNPSGFNRQNVVTEGVQGDNYPRWSPDRTRVTYSANPGTGPNQLHVRTALGDTVAHLTSMADTSTRRPRYNSTGQRLAFECGDGFSTAQDVCVIADVTAPVGPSLDGIGDDPGGKVYVTDSISTRLGGSGAFAWDPQNANRLAVVRDTTILGRSASRIYTVNFDGTGLVQLSGPVILGADTIRVLDLDWAPNGSFLVFSGQPQPITGGSQGIFRINSDGSGLTRLTSSANREFRPVLSPDGSEVLFVRDVACQLRYVIVNTTTGIQRVEIPSTTTCDGGDALVGHDWSPDGSEIVLVDDNAAGSTVIFVVPSSVTAATYTSVRREVGRVKGAPFVTDIQPSWRP